MLLNLARPTGKRLLGSDTLCRPFNGVENLGEAFDILFFLPLCEFYPYELPEMEGFLEWFPPRLVRFRGPGLRVKLSTI